MKDLILLVADKDAEQTLKALLGERQQSLGIHLIQYDIKFTRNVTEVCEVAAWSFFALIQVYTDTRLFYELAQTVSLRGCTDPAFQKLVHRLKQWFPADSHPL